MAQSKDRLRKRLLNLIVGVLYVILAFYVAINPAIAVGSMIIILAFVLVISGALRVLNAFYDDDIGGTYRILRLLFGVIGIFLGISVMAIPALGLEILVLLLSIGLLFQGLTRVINAISLSDLSFWLRIVIFLLGVITIGLSIYVFVSIETAILTLVLFLSYGFLLNGSGRILIAILGSSGDSSKKA